MSPRPEAATPQSPATADRKRDAGATASSDGMTAVAAPALQAGSLAQAQAQEARQAVVTVPVPPRPALASTQAAQSPSTDAPSAAGAIGGTVFALLLVVGLIFGLAWLARRMPGVAGQRNNGLRLVGSLSLGPRERVVVVEVAGTQLLLGVGAAGTRRLHTLDTPLSADPPAPPLPFAKVMAQHFGRSP